MVRSRIPAGPSFLQPPPELGNQYDDDRVLGAYLRRVLAAEVLVEIEPELREMGELAGGELYRASLADRLNEPRLTRWSAWGERIDEVETTAVWRRAERLAAQRGVVAAAYERRHGRHSRPHQFTLAYLFTPSTDLYSCPLAMTDGAARALLASGERELIGRAVPRLTSRDPERFWTSGQWMTETAGGSDVGGTGTVARPAPEVPGGWRLSGRKWFTSAVGAQTALALARPEGDPPGPAGLSLFYLETRDAEGRNAGIRIERLKDKLGTRKLPTAELFLDGVPAWRVGEPRGGVRAITPMLNLTRAWNAVSAAALMRRGIALARDYARRRVAFGAPLADKPLHRDTLAGLQAEFEGAFLLTFRVVELLGRLEAGDADAADRTLLRALTPIVKLTTAKQAVAVTSEVLECFGGAGYVEDTGLPALLRDAQVLPIWEGTTNVLALDLLRALGDAGVAPLAAEVERALEGIASAGEAAGLATPAAAARAAVRSAGAWLSSAAASSRDDLEAGARRFALTLGRALELALTVEQAAWSLRHESDPRPAAAARRLTAAGVDLLAEIDPDNSRCLALDAITAQVPAPTRPPSTSRRLAHRSARRGTPSRTP